MKRFAIIVFSLFVTFHFGYTQTRSVNEKVTKDKQASRSELKSSSTSSSWVSNDDDDGSGNLLVDIFVVPVVEAVTFIFYKGFRDAHQAVMNNYSTYPDLVSFQGTLGSGFNFDDNGFTIIPAVRGNYGLFATDLRYVNMRDVTGRLQSIDWQVLMFRVPVKNIRLEYGLGFSHVMSPSKTYFDSSLGFDGNFLDYALNIQGQYRWSQKTSFGSRYRQEYSIEAGLQVAQSRRLRVVPFIGYSHFNYFNEIDFNYLKAGIKLRIF